MTTQQHAQQPNDHQPPRLTPERQALRDMWLAEMWPVCHEAHRAPIKTRRTAA